MPQPVTKGQTIKLVPESQWQQITVKWQQKFRDNSGEYFKADFENLSPDTEQGLSVFIQKEKLSNFKSVATRDGDNLKISTNDEFVYGQSWRNQYRWLVYHDRDRCPYQHRFIEGMLGRLGNREAETAKAFGFSDAADSLATGVKVSISNPLRSF